MNSLFGAILLFGSLAWLCSGKRKAIKRNLDAFTDSRGIIHPIRGSEGYSNDTERIGRIPIMTGGRKPPEKKVKISAHVKEIPIKVMGKPLRT